MAFVASRRSAIGVLALVGVAWAGFAYAQPVSFSVELTGAQQVPPVQTAALGKADLTYDPSTRAVTWSVAYSGFSSPATMAHFHGPAAAGANGPVAIWLSKQGAPADSPITGQATLSPDQAAQFAAGQWYINVHSKDHPTGEIRGQVIPPKG
jgi:hypothetical protein